jgi:hypothetical protein
VTKSSRFVHEQTPNCRSTADPSEISVKRDEKSDGPEYVFVLDADDAGRGSAVCLDGSNPEPLMSALG